MAPFQPQIFVNLPVANLQKAHAFYNAIGLTCNPLFSDQGASCMVLSEHISVMIMTHEKFKEFMPSSKDLVSGRNGTEALLCITVEKKETVDEILEKGEQMGGKKNPTVLPEMEGMYGRSLEDVDGHVWEIMYMGGLEEAMKNKEKEVEKEEGKNSGVA
ncbi:hypothetical protein DL769_008904 [Monosporascus sp. CRB-8-3]|nr:hypothetical protein DL769_008904 [Monosporascus sp. CRB-8-3]